MQPVHTECVSLRRILSVMSASSEVCNHGTDAFDACKEVDVLQFPSMAPYGLQEVPADFCACVCICRQIWSEPSFQGTAVSYHCTNTHAIDVLFVFTHTWRFFIFIFLLKQRWKKKKKKKERKKKKNKKRRRNKTTTKERTAAYTRPWSIVVRDFHPSVSVICFLRYVVSSDITV